MSEGSGGVGKQVRERCVSLCGWGERRMKPSI